MASSCRSAGSVKPETPVDTTSRGSKMHTIICTGYRKGKHAPSCRGDSHKSCTWGQGGSYQKLHLCLNALGKGPNSQMTLRPDGVEGGGGLDNRGAGLRFGCGVLGTRVRCQGLRLPSGDQQGQELALVPSPQKHAPCLQSWAAQGSIQQHPVGG